MIDPHPVPHQFSLTSKGGGGGVHNSSFCISMGIEQMMTSDDNGGK